MKELKIYSPESFVETVYPELFSGKEKLRAVFSSYNVITKESGFVKTDADNLEMFVINGCREQSMRGLGQMLATGYIEDRELANALFDQVVEYDEKQVNKSLACINDTSEGMFDPDAEFLYFTYVGLNSIDNAIQFAVDIKKTYKNATVIVLACDCSKSQKIYAFKNAFEVGKIDHVIITSHCGGGRSMKFLIEEMKEKWK